MIVPHLVLVAGGREGGRGVGGGGGGGGVGRNGASVTLQSRSTASANFGLSDIQNMVENGSKSAPVWHVNIPGLMNVFIMQLYTSS